MRREFGLWFLMTKRAGNKRRRVHPLDELWGDTCKESHKFGKTEPFLVCAPLTLVGGTTDTYISSSKKEKNITFRVSLAAIPFISEK